MADNNEDDNYEEEDDDYNDDEPTLPTLINNSSQQRAITESKMDKKLYKARKKALQQRMSIKQRMSFNDLVERNIHAGLEDSLYEKKPMEQLKRILQLTRRFSHRPRPHDIQNDEDLPKDLKIADRQYFKMYQYRNATKEDFDSRQDSTDDTDDPVRPQHNRTSSDPNPVNDEEVIKKRQSQILAANPIKAFEDPLSWKIGQRSDIKDLKMRGIIPEHFVDVAHGNKSLQQAKQEWEEYRKRRSNQITNRIDLKLRPTKDDLQQRGIVPDWDDPTSAYDKRQEMLEKNKENLDMKYRQRMPPNEAHQRAFIDENELYNLDHDESVAKKKEEQQKLKLKMEVSLKQRAGKSEVSDRGIMHPDYFDKDVDEVRRNKIEHKKTLTQQMEEALRTRPTPQEIFDTYGASDHRLSTQSVPVPIPSFNKLQTPVTPYDETKNLSNLPTTPEYDEIDDNQEYAFPTFLDRMKEEKKSIKRQLKDGMRRRSTIEDLQTKGILPMNFPLTPDDYDDSSDEDKFHSFLDRMQAEKTNHRESLKMLHKKRVSVDILEKRGILKKGQYFNVEQAEDSNIIGLKSQVYMSDAYAKSLNKTRDSDEGDDDDLLDDDTDDDDDYPTFLDRYRKEKEENRRKLEKKHRGRPSMNDLEAMNIVPKGYFNNMPVVLKKQHERRQSFTTELAHFFTNRPDIAEMLTKGLVAAEFIGMEPDDARRGPKQKRKELRKKLNRKLNKKRRPTMDELELRGIVPAGYFSKEAKWQSAYKKKHIRRMTAEKDIGKFLPQRMDPRKLMERGILPKQQFQFITGVPIPIPTYVPASPRIVEEPDEDSDDSDVYENVNANNDNQVNITDVSDNYVMSKQQQAFSSGAMGVASIFAQQMLNKTVLNNNNNNNNQPVVEQQEYSPPLNNNSYNAKLQKPKKKSSRRHESALGKIVLELPQHAERNLFDHDNWTQNLYESLLSSLKFEQITQRIEKEKTSSNFQTLTNILEKYHEFERNYHTNMNSLKREKKSILDQIDLCDKEEKESFDILSKLMMEHSELEQKIRPQMKMLLHKMTLVETRMIRLNNNNNENDNELRREYENELNYYDTYITELKNVFIHTNNIRSKYTNTIRSVITHKETLDIKLKIKDKEITKLETDLYSKFNEFHKLITSVTSEDSNNNNDDQHKSRNGYNDGYDDDEVKYDPLTADPITDLKSVLDNKSKNIDDNLDLLAFRISTIPATDYALRVMELCQLSYIYNSDKLRSFFEWFIKFAVQTFIEINYAHTCFTTQNKKAITNEISQLKSIKFIAELTPAMPLENKKNYETALYEELTVIMSYLTVLPSNDENDVNTDHENVIFHVARYLSADFVFSKNTELRRESEIPRMAQNKVNEWIATILKSSKSDFVFNKDMSKIQNTDINKPRNIIKATKHDSIARIRPSRAAAIVLDQVYGIHVEG